jgi:phosphopantothenoylcysteine decarboxylase/phosphopantothenate--cysteine ligase
VKKETTDPLKEIMGSKSSRLSGKRVVLCVTGSVASIEVPRLARELMREGAEVYPVMSEAAERLVRPEILEWATGNPVVRKLTGRTEHVRLAGEWSGKADLLLIAPCTANTISKIALGIDDTPVTTLASMAIGNSIPIIICPAAHEPMYRNPIVRQNIDRLEQLGIEFVGPKFEEGKAKMAEVNEIVDSVIKTLSAKDMVGMKVVVTGGPTIEYIDPVRVVTNLSSGKTGLLIAMEAWRRGAKVKYIYGGNLMPPKYIPSVKVSTTDEMLDAVLQELQSEKCDVFISAAAPSDFRPVEPRNKKIPSRAGSLSITLVPTRKIVSEVRKMWPKLYVVAFKAETVKTRSELEQAAEEFLEESDVNMVVANDVSDGKGFGADTNTVMIVGGGKRKVIENERKEIIAKHILDRVVINLRGKGQVGIKKQND